MYFTFRITITNVGKFKTIVNEQTYEYKIKYKESKEKFWRIAVIFIIKTILKAIALASIGVPVFYGYAYFNPQILDLQLPLWGLAILSLFGGLCFLGDVYLLIRLEFASVIVYWDVDSDISDLGTSMRMTKHDLFNKMKVMFVAHLPGMVMALVSLIYIFMEVDSASGWLGLLNIIVSVIINTALFSWIYSLYYPMFEQIKAFTFEKELTVDSEGREWTTY
jgi:hypothetical protein